METLCYAMLAGYPVMAAAIAVLWRAYHKVQQDRLRQAERHAQVLRSLREMMERRTQ